MTASYQIKLSFEHTSWIARDLDLDDLVLQYDARIVHETDPDDDDAGETVGKVQFYVVKLGLAMNESMNAMQACDAVSHDVYGYGGAVLRKDGTFRTEIANRFELAGGDLLILHTVTVVPAHRGHDLGLLAASRIIDLFGEGFVMCKPQPLQHVRDTDEHRASLAPELRYDLFTKPRTAAKAALQHHWGRLGFQRIGRTDFYGLSTSVPRPPLQLRSKSTRRAGGRSGRVAAPTGRRSRPV